MSFLTLVNRLKLSGEFFPWGRKADSGFRHCWCDQRCLAAKKVLGLVFSVCSSNQTTSSLLPASHRNYPLALSQTPLLTPLLMHPVLFCYHFPQWQAPFPLSVTDGRQSQLQQSVLTCLHLSCPSPLPHDSSCSQPLQRASQCLWQFSCHFCYPVAQSGWMSPLRLPWVKSSSYTEQLQLHLAQLRRPLIPP